ncbi:MAG: helix-turn-helix transcriptional regulator [Bacteroidales bacterium]|nr:helix-turn-helix transcriptional regulator [Bacteroidales bacterium]
MIEGIKEIAKRLYGLRESLDLTIEEFIEGANLTVEEYEKAESGDYDISVSLMQRIAKKHHVPLEVLMFGSEPKMSRYFVTRAGKGEKIERTKAYRYQSLAAGFINRKADPFLVTVAPKTEDVPIYYNTHDGQEFNMVIKGQLLIDIEGKELILNEGDSIYFDARLPHGMKALGGEKVQFLAVIL